MTSAMDRTTGSSNSMPESRKSYVFYDKCPESITPGHLLFALEVSRDCRVFLEFKDFESFKDFYIREDNKHYYEVIIGPHRFYLDVDIESEADISFSANAVISNVESKASDSFENGILQNIIKAITRVFEDIDIRKEIFVFSSHGKDIKKEKVIIKKSFHILVHRVINTPELSKAVAILIKNYSGVSSIDINVYKPKQQLRVLYSTKLESKRIKIFEGNWIFEGEWICSQISKEDELKYSLVTLPLDAKNDSMRLSKLLIVSPTSIKRKNTSNSTKTMIARRILKNTEEDISKSIEGSENLQVLDIIDYKGSYLITLKNRGGYMCPIHKRIHEKENPFVIADMSNSFFHCRRRDDTGDKRVFYLRENNERTGVIKKTKRFITI
jgi:hypothetical protein